MKAAIEWIRWALKLGTSSRGEVGVSDMEAESFKKILPILEAADKLTADDIQRLLQLANARLPEYLPLPGYICPGKILKDKFRALLESLPDKE